ncbi:Asp-tRNA(Asn)/Glu-tRNA(Gln) amidotransferase subunit GatB [Candidatus Woesearchaeota archaeon]|nr:Asp-tRNA(Asn)/Glu-tRNA(Gln) amidotransferase subunit GatB [Candidatus Woesearchaeota archaeon]
MKNFTSDVIIGLEVHIELNTKTKLFCSCPTHGSEEPNTRTCPICLGMPGSKPVLNKKAVEFALKLCLALNCETSPELIFSRKSYFYPDMSKNYQISQYEIPLGKNGKLRLSHGKEIGITRVHMEEDPASLVHPSGLKESAYVLVDYNRSGNPLVEIVTEPELQSPDEARDFMKQLIGVLNYLEIFDINEGIIKADANISIRESGYKRVEIKNITGFREIERALFYEVKRQKEEAHKIEQETRAWDSEKGITFSLRKKETEEDYGYIIDTDLTLVEITDKWIREIKKVMPELAQEKIKKFIGMDIKRDDAEVLASDKFLANMFEKVAEEINPLLAAKWLRRELVRVLK